MSEDARYGSGNGTEIGYVVEARSILNKPIALQCGTMLDSEWRRIHFLAAPLGVFVQSWAPGFTEQGFLDFTSAHALAYWFVSNAREDKHPSMRALGVEVRLARVKYLYSYSAIDDGAGPTLPVSGRDEPTMIFTPRTQPRAEDTTP